MAAIAHPRAYFSGEGMLGVLAAEIHLMPDWTVAVQMGIFFAALGVLVFLIFRPTLRIIDRRRKFTEEARSNADRLNAEADRLDEERRRSIAAALAEANGRCTAQLESARASAEKIVADARQGAKGLIETTEVSVESSEEAVGGEVARVAEELAGEIARRVMPSSAKG